MMRVVKIYLVLALIISFVGLNAQNTYTFKVLVSKGKTELKSGTAWSPLRVGASLNTSDEIKLGNNSYLGLISANGKPLELKEPGTHKVVNLAKQLGKEKSVLNKYTDFILSSEESKKNRLAATGAVHRGTGNQIALFLPPAPQGGKVYGDRVLLNWLPAEDANSYIVIFKTLFEEEIARIESETTSLEVDLSDKPLAGHDVIKIKVLSKSDPASQSAEFAIARMSGKEKAEVKKEINELGLSQSEASGFNKFYLAGLYEQKLLVIDAITAYQDAIRLEPEVDYYEQAYKDFLSRLGLLPEN